MSVLILTIIWLTDSILKCNIGSFRYLLGYSREIKRYYIRMWSEHGSAIRFIFNQLDLLSYILIHLFLFLIIFKPLHLQEQVIWVVWY